MECYEFSLRESVERFVILEKLSSFFGISIDRIVDSNAYWDLSDEQQKHILCADVLYSDTGLRTLVRGYSPFDFSSEKLAEFAKYCAANCNTEVAIGDYTITTDEQDLLLVYFPDGSVAKAIDGALDDSNDITITEYLPAISKPKGVT